MMRIQITHGHGQTLTYTVADEVAEQTVNDWKHKTTWQTHARLGTLTVADPGSANSFRTVIAWSAVTSIAYWSVP